MITFRFRTLAAMALCSLVFACERRADPGTASKKESTSSRGLPGQPEKGVKSPAGLAAMPQPPAVFGKLRIPKDNALTPTRIELGHRLFFDARLSVDGSHSCYSCHRNEDGTGGHEPRAIGPGNVQLPRHAPVIWNAAFLPRLYWDGRAESLEAQARGAWAGGNLGVGEENLDAKAREIAAIPAYAKAFDEAYPGEGVSPDTIVRAIASYERTLFCADTAWDSFQAGNAGALDPKQKAGWELFIGKARCNNCHTPPFFSDAYTAEQGMYHNTGVGMAGKSKDEIDPGRSKVSGNPSEFGAFKTPTLRNVAKSAPYFHDGSAATLEEAVRFMAKGGYANDNLDPNMVDRELSDDEIDDLLAFLGALTCQGSLEEPELP
jgi:cytochrome c peroxidase